jgi:hypothetical protein
MAWSGLDFDRCRITPFDHQKIGTEALVRYPYFALFDEMGAGKTKQVIDAVQFLFVNGYIDKVLVIVPAAVRSVWFDQELGELAKHLWKDVSSLVLEYHEKSHAWIHAPAAENKAHRLEWYITNYDYIRRRVSKVGRKKINIDPMIEKIIGPRTLLVLDESSAVKNHKAKQSRACLIIRNRCGRVVLLNGTPISNNPLDLYSQGMILHPSVHGFKSYFTFKAQYAQIITTEAGFPKIVGWQNLEDLQRRFAPYVLRRLKKDCLDLPEKLPSAPLTATLSSTSWKIYTEMRDELCVWLSENEVSTAAQAGVKIMRLAQIVSGFVGGVEPALFDDDETEVRRSSSPVRFFGNEKITTLIEWLKELWDNEPDAKVVVWTRFRPELFNVMKALEQFGPKLSVGQIHGVNNQTEKDEQDAAKRLLDPRTAPEGPAVVVGITSVGSMGLTLNSGSPRRVP